MRRSYPETGRNIPGERLVQAEQRLRMERRLDWGLDEATQHFRDGGITSVAAAFIIIKQFTYYSNKYPGMVQKFCSRVGEIDVKLLVILN
jgi:hypothetical protein